MRVYCIKCAKAVGQIADEKLPSDKTVYIKCPLCQTRIPLKKDEPIELQLEEQIASKQDVPRASAVERSRNVNHPSQTRVPEQESTPSQLGVRKPGYPLKTIAVALFILLFAFIGLRFWSQSKIFRLFELGPSRISQNDSSLAIYMDNRIYRVEKSGQVIKAVNLEELGLDAPVADVEILKDNSVLIGIRGTGTISRCDLDNLSCYDVSPTGEFRLEDNFRFLVMEEYGVIYLADTIKHRLMIHQLDGSHTRIVDSDVSFPNDMVIEGDTLYLCDTYNSRVLTYTIQPDGDLERDEAPFIAFASFTTPAGLKSLAGMSQQELKEHLEQKAEETKGEDGRKVMIDRPIAIARDPSSGNWWVGMTSEADLFGSEVQIFSAEGDFLTRLPAPGNSLAEDIALLDGNMIVTDPEHLDVFSINPATYQANGFGGEGLRDDLDSLQTQYSIASFFNKWSTRIMFLVGACLLGLLFYIKSQE